MSKQNESKNSKKGGRIAIAICIVMILVLLVVVIYLLLGRKEEPVKRNVVVNKDNVDEILEQLEDPVPTGSYEVKMNSTWDFARGDAPSDNAYVENVEANTNSVYFDVVRTDTDETIFESPILPVGSYLENITLDSNLSAGTYECLVTYHILDENDESMSTVKLTLTINIGQ